jgi:hypothetical protein
MADKIRSAEPGLNSTNNRRWTDCRLHADQAPLGNGLRQPRADTTTRIIPGAASATSIAVLANT